MSKRNKVTLSGHEFEVTDDGRVLIDGEDYDYNGEEDELTRAADYMARVAHYTSLLAEDLVGDSGIVIGEDNRMKLLFLLLQEEAAQKLDIVKAATGRELN